MKFKLPKLPKKRFKRELKLLPLILLLSALTALLFVLLIDKVADFQFVLLVGWGLSILGFYISRILAYYLKIFLDTSPPSS